MNNIQLEYFVAVVEEGTLRKAAERMFVSQSAISVAISGLEQELGHYLFRRSRSGMVLTDFGERVYGQTEAVLREMEGIRQITREEDEHISIRVAFIPAFAGVIMGNAMTEFRRQYPNAKVELNERRIGRADGDHTSVKDFSFILMVQMNKPTSLMKKDRKDKMVFAEAGMYAWVNKDSPLASKALLTAEDCEGYLLLSQHGYIEELHRSLPDADINEFTSVSIPRYLCSDVEAIGFIPGIFGMEVASLGESCPAVPRRIDFYDGTFTYCAYYDAKRPLSTPEKVFIELIKQETIKQIQKTEAMADAVPEA